MKTSHSTNQNSKASTAKNYCPLVIKIERGEPPVVTKTNSVVFKLYTNPSDTDSPQFEMTVMIFKSGEPEDWILTRRAIQKVIHGLALTTGPNQYQQVRRILQGDALATFNTAAQAAGTETQANLKTALDTVTKHIFPRNALQKQKRYMRRFMRKPRWMNVKEYNARLEELVEYLEWFCDSVNATTPCPRPDQKLKKDEILDILYFSIPAKWTKQAIIQGFNTLEKDRDEFVAFCERLKECESFDGNDMQPSGDRKPRAQSRHTGKRKSTGGNDQTNCMLHGANRGHNTEDCKVLQAQAKRMRGMYDALSEADRAKMRKANRYKNKDSYKSKFSSKAELHAIIAASVQKELRQQSSASGKRKHSKKKDLNVAEMPSDVSHEGDDEVSEDDLDQFNFENLKVSMSDDESDLDNLSL